MVVDEAPASPVSILPIGIEALVSGAVETARLEFKRTWDEKTTLGQVQKTLCAFANDLQNLNGGYVIIGMGEVDGVADRPAHGLDAARLDDIQKKIRGACNQLDPQYAPILSPETLDGRWVLVIWAPASEVRPHLSPTETVRSYFVRIGSQTVEAKGDLLRRLMQQTARVPFDDRRAFEAEVTDLRESRVRSFLHDVKSRLSDERDVALIFRQMHLLRRANGHEVPRNIALMFFSDDPDLWFRGARIEVVEFPDDAGGNLIAERTFRGPLHEQLRQCQMYLANLATRHLVKSPDRIETRGWASYPTQALDEAVTNAIYHRSYEDSVEPTKIYLYPDRIEIISYPGPVEGIEREHLTGDQPLPPVPARNRRIGELLKEVRLAEGRGTGIPKIKRAMRENGSPEARFEFDAGRTYFKVTLPAHPEYVALAALREYAYLQATGDEAQALRHLQQAWKSRPTASLASQLIRALVAQGDLDGARNTALDFAAEGRVGSTRVLLELGSVLLDHDLKTEAEQLLARLPDLASAQDACDMAILWRRIGDQKRAHQLFLQAGELVQADVRALLEFAQTKIKLADEIFHGAGGRPSGTQNAAKKRLLEEAERLLLRVVQLDAAPTKHGWAWFNLGQVRHRLQRPRDQVLAALNRAIELCPTERRFAEELERRTTPPRSRRETS